MQKTCSFYLVRNKGIIITIIRKIESYTYIDLEIIQIKDNIYSTELIKTARNSNFFVLYMKNNT